MTESEWLACVDPKMMLDFVPGKACERKIKLFCASCSWRLHRFLSDYSRHILSVVERAADIELSSDEFTSLSDDAMAYADGLSYHMGTPEGCAQWLAASAVWSASESDAFQTSLDAAC